MSLATVLAHIQIPSGSAGTGPGVTLADPERRGCEPVEPASHLSDRSERHIRRTHDADPPEGWRVSGRES
jgi:hypothetical protein